MVPRVKGPILLEPPFNQPLFARALRTALLGRTPRSLTLPSALSPHAAQRLRNLARPHCKRFDLADRGCYTFTDLYHAELHALARPLLDELQRFAQEVSGAALGAGGARIVWLGRGDYALRLDDARLRPHQEFLEATLDLSPSPHPFAGIVYSEGASIHLPIAQLPGQISLVWRGPASTRCDRYRNRFVGAHACILLRAAFPLAES